MLRGKEKARKESYSFSLNELYMERVYELAELLGISPSEVIRRAIDEYYLGIMERISRINNFLPKD